MTCGAASHVLRPGYLPDAAIPALLRRAGAIVYPSLQEGFGLPALEALACGAVVVTSRESAMEEFAHDVAISVDPHEVSAIAAGIERALDPVVAAELRVLGPARAAEYTWDRSVEIHLEAYADAARAKAAA
jgi:glycosyltransferase involved in cell wall biosynthesis